MSVAPGERRSGAVRVAVGLVLMATVVSGCSGAVPDGPTASASTSAPGATADEQGARDEQQFPDVLAVELRPAGEEWDVLVTLSSPYDTPERYADGWRVLAPDGTVLGEHTLGHDHAAEQPFTRTQPGLAIPDGVREVTVEGRDQANGFGGSTVTVPVPSS